jgi:hypothetical protein
VCRLSRLGVVVTEYQVDVAVLVARASSESSCLHPPSEGGGGLNSNVPYVHPGLIHSSCTSWGGLVPGCDLRTISSTLPAFLRRGKTRHGGGSGSRGPIHCLSNLLIRPSLAPNFIQ